MSYCGKKSPAMVADMIAYAPESNHSTKLPMAVAVVTLRRTPGASAPSGAGGRGERGGD
ncbi:hypothetical protein GA0115235_109226 [Streptomyces sp. DpondAA-F4a]|nr:hypothetical protein GA0115235_109226 [Streptomyces sp. DpondAA-F4a]